MSERHKAEIPTRYPLVEDGGERFVELFAEAIERALKSGELKPPPSENSSPPPVTELSTKALFLAGLAIAEGWKAKTSPKSPSRRSPLGGGRRGALRGEGGEHVRQDSGGATSHPSRGEAAATKTVTVASSTDHKSQNQAAASARQGRKKLKDALVSTVIVPVGAVVIILGGVRRHETMPDNALVFFRSAENAYANSALCVSRGDGP